MFLVVGTNLRPLLILRMRLYRGNELKLILWGERAVQFDGEAVRDMGAKEPVIAIFVGMLPKTARGNY